MSEYICIDEFDIENDVFEITNSAEEDVSVYFFHQFSRQAFAFFDELVTTMLVTNFSVKMH